MAKEQFEIATVGQGACANCGAVGPVRRAKTGRLCQTCTSFKGSGQFCSQNFSRSKAGDDAFAGRMKKWAKPEYRAQYLGGSAPAPEAAPGPAPSKPARPAEEWL